MNLIKLLSGHRFELLKHEAEKIESSIKKSHCSLTTSLASKERLPSSQWFRRSIPNPLPVGIVCLLLVAPLAWEGGTIIDYLSLPIETGAITLLSILPVTAIYIALIPFTLGKGFKIGLTLILYFHLFNTLLTLAGLVLMLLKSADNQEWMKALNFFPFQLLLIFLCKYTINSESFYRLILFTCNTRLIIERSKIRSN